MKKRNLFSLAAIAVVFVASFAACTKYTNQDSSRLEISKNSKPDVKTLSASCAPNTGALPVTITPANQDAVIDAYAALHNDYLNYYFASLSNQTLTFPSSQYDEHFRNTAISYFGSNSVYVNNGYYDCVQSSNPDTDLSQYRSSFSPSGVVVYDQLCSLVDNYDVDHHSEFVLNLNDLYLTCNTLTGNEQVTLKFAIKIAINSFTYWKDNGDTWISYYRNNYSGSGGAYAKANNRQLLSNAGKADVSGAIRGAIGGGLGAGPAGAVAGGLVVAGVSSAASIVWDAIFG